MTNFVEHGCLSPTLADQNGVVAGGTVNRKDVGSIVIDHVLADKVVEVTIDRIDSQFIRAELEQVYTGTTILNIDTALPVDKVGA